MTDQQIDEFLEMLAKSPTSARYMVRGLFAAHEAKAAPAVPEKLPSGMATSQDGGKWRVTLEFDAHSDAAALHDYMLRNGVPSKSMVAAPAVPFCYASVNKQGDVTSTHKRKDSWRTVPLYTAPPAAPAPAVPQGEADSVQREIAAALALLPIDFASQTFCVSGFRNGQPLEADGDTEFFSKKKVIALLEKLHGHLIATLREKEQAK